MSRLFFTLLMLSAVSLRAQVHTNVTFTHEGHTVFATFSKPSATGLFPTVVINPGSGANDRHGTLPMVGGNAACLYPGLYGDTLRAYRDLANALVDSGFAVLRYDKLEFTYPTTLAPITFEKLWLPVNSAIDAVKSLPGVDTNRIVLIGHSEGAALIPYIARERNDVKALVSIAGPRTPFDSLLAYQILYITQYCNGNMATAQTQATQILQYYNIIRTNTWNAGTPPLFGVSAAVWYDYIRVIDSVAINYNLNNVPKLFIGLGEDINVPPAELTRFQNELSGNVTFYELPGLNHYMTTMNSAAMSETISDTIVHWLRNQGVTAVPNRLLTPEDVRVFVSGLNLVLEQKQPQSGTLEIFAMDGRLLRSIDVPAVARFAVNTNDLPPGIIAARFKNSGKAVVAKMVITR